MHLLKITLKISLKSKLWVFFMDHAFGIVATKPFICTLYLFVLLSLTLRPVTLSGFISMMVVRSAYRFTFLWVDVQLFPCHLLKRMFFSIVSLLPKDQQTVLCGLFQDDSVFLINLPLLFLFPFLQFQGSNQRPLRQTLQP